MASVKDTLAAAERMGFSLLDMPVRPETAAPASTRRTPAANTARIPAKEPSPESVTRSYEIRKAALDSLGERYGDDTLPDIETVTIPRNPAALDAVRDSVSGIVESAADLPLGAASRRYMSTRGLVQGEPITPTVRRIVEAADRPLSTLEITTAFLQMRGLNLKRRELTALSNRISSLLSLDASRGRLTRIDQEDSRIKLWSWPRQPEKSRTGRVRHVWTASSLQGGST